MEIRDDKGEMVCVITDEGISKRQTSFIPDWLPTGLTTNGDEYKIR